MMYVQGSVPSELNKSLFIALPKVNGSIKCGKHRAISLINHVKYHSCTTDPCERSIEKHKYVYVCFIDYSKAFDTVKHKLFVGILQSRDVDQT